ncbi:MAG TPA: hypothetical protein VNZ45_01520, partial [Bacteroidia bacterium]|nr:hypothetical protein [Bacteroidia bacterium]
MEKLPVLLSIDPSVRDLGWAILDLNKGEGEDYYNLDSDVWSYGLVQMKARPISYKDPYYLQHRWREACATLKAACEIGHHQPTHLASEWPVYFNSTRGRIAVERNYTVDLGSMVGYIAGQFNFRANYMTLWTPQQ